MQSIAKSSDLACGSMSEQDHRL